MSVSATTSGKTKFGHRLKPPATYQRHPVYQKALSGCRAIKEQNTVKVHSQFIYSHLHLHSFKSPINPFKQSKLSAIFEKKNSIPFLFLTMVTSKKPRLNHRLVYKEHNPSASQSFISTVILEKKRNDLHTVSSSNHSSADSEVSSGSSSVFWLRFVLILCLKHFVLCLKHFVSKRHFRDFAMTSFETLRMF